MKGRGGKLTENKKSYSMLQRCVLHAGFIGLRDDIGGVEISPSESEVEACDAACDVLTGNKGAVEMTRSTANIPTMRVLSPTRFSFE